MDTQILDYFSLYLGWIYRYILNPLTVVWLSGWSILLFLVFLALMVAFLKDLPIIFTVLKNKYLRLFFLKIGYAHLLVNRFLFINASELSRHNFLLELRDEQKKTLLSNHLVEAYKEAISSRRKPSMNVESLMWPPKYPSLFQLDDYFKQEAIEGFRGNFIKAGTSDLSIKGLKDGDIQGIRQFIEFCADVFFSESLRSKRLRRLEDRLLEIEEEKPRRTHNAIENYSGDWTDEVEANEIAYLDIEKAQLGLMRQFILDRRNGLRARIIWNIIVPIVVAILTTYIMSSIRQ